LVSATNAKKLEVFGPPGDAVALGRALERLGVEPHDVLHVGDSDVDDVRGAKGAGMKVAWVNRDRRPRRADVPPPDFEIADLTELPALLERTTRVR